MGAVNTNVTAVASMANAKIMSKLLRMNEEGQTNFEILEVRAIKELANGHNTQATIRVDLAFGQEGLPMSETDRYSVRHETFRRVHFKDVADFQGLDKNELNQYVGTVTTVDELNALFNTNLVGSEVVIKTVAGSSATVVSATPNNLGFIGGLTFSGGEVVETNPDATYSAQLTFGDEYNNNLHADHLNAGDLVNLVIVGDGLVEPQLVEIDLSSGGGAVVAELEQTRYTLNPGATLVIPVMIESATPDGSTITALVKNIGGDILAVTHGATVHDPEIVLATVTINNPPANMPANTDFGTFATIDANYTPRVVVWGSDQGNKVTFTQSADNPLNAQVHLGDLAPGTEVTLTCTVDGVVGTSTVITIVEA